MGESVLIVCRRACLSYNPAAMRRVVVTGIGVVCPLGLGSRAFWEGLLAGRCGIRRIAGFDPSGLACQIGGEVPPYRIVDYVPKSYRKATKVMARDIELAVIAADDAFRDANLASKAYVDSPTIPSARFGCNIGAGLINTDLSELAAAFDTARRQDDPGAVDLVRWGRHGMEQLTPLWLLKYLPNMLACHVTIIHGLTGPSNTITCAEASSHLAIGEAFRTIQRGDADLAICGGAEAKVQPMSMLRHGLLKRLNESCNDRPDRAVLPFDPEARGTVLGDGAGLLILEEMGHAVERGARIYAEVAGFGVSQDTHSITQPSPDGRACAAALRLALREAGVGAEGLDLIVPNGLGIAAHDRAELAGYRAVLGQRLASVPMAVVKPRTGALSAGCGVDVAGAVLSIAHRKIPPAPNVPAASDGQALNVSPEPRDADVRVAVSSVYSVGGQNAALVFRAAG